jgi:arylsulfatase A-like enzyme
MITGMYQTAIGAHSHRSSRGTVKHTLPSHIKLIPELFKEAGYYTCNTSETFKRYGKTDYNFVFDNEAIYDGPDWSRRKPDQPFFAQIHLRGGKLRNVPKWYTEVKAGLDKLVTSDQVTLPPYYPDDPVFRNDWAEYLNSVQYFMTDHGISQARGKQFLYDEGAKIPFIVWDPKRVKSGAVCDDLVAHIDMSATSLYFAGIDIPQYMQARPLFGPMAEKRQYVVCGRDRCDETVDRIRSVVKGNYKYIRNFYPDRPYLQPCAYKDHKPFMKTLRQLYANTVTSFVKCEVFLQTGSSSQMTRAGSANRMQCSTVI